MSNRGRPCLHAEPLDGGEPTLMGRAGVCWPRVVACVPAHNRLAWTLRFLEHAAEIDYPNLGIVVVDDGSTDGTGEAVAERYPEVTVLTGDGDLWWSGATNAAIRYALDEPGTDYILTINDDATYDPGFLRRMVETAMEDPRRIVGCRIHCQDEPGLLWGIGTSCVFSGVHLYRLNFGMRTWKELEGRLPDPYPVETMPGNGVLIPRAVFDEVGFYDERSMPQYHADSDLVLRAAKAGFKPVIALRAAIYNHVNTTPLVDNVADLLLSRKSDLNARAVWTTLSRHAPVTRWLPVLACIYLPFLTPEWAKRIYRRTIKPVLRRVRPLDPPVPEAAGSAP
ncbi:MAG: glycosyltransferase family 2 protein [Phycisphaeraceae bacterium]|nr:MAG: glycosyltransferase family 2 protein [Phycisphaeraceae bacterium]